MKYSIESETAVCRSPEAEALSGVSQQLQRDWRRRGLIAEHTGPGQVRYTLWQVCQLKIMGILSQAHINVKPAGFVIDQIAYMVEHNVRTNPASAEILGLDLSDEEKAEVVRLGNVEGAISDFTMFRLPELPEQDQRTSYYVSGTWAGLFEMAQADGGLSAVLVVDAAAVAREIVAASSRPLVTYRLTPIEGAE